MPAPTVATYSLVTLLNAHNFFKTQIDAGAGPGLIRVRSATDVLLSQITLTDPCGTVNGTTGQLVLGIAGPDTNAAASGTAAYAEICDSAGTVHLALPAQAGGAAVSGYIVLNALTVVASGTVEVLSVVIG